MIGTEKKFTDEGYQITELGEIPSEWKVEILGNFIKIRSGAAPSKIKELKEFGKYPFYKVNDLNYTDKYLSKAIYNFDDLTFKKIKKNSIVFPKRGASIFTNKIAIISKSGYMDTNLMALEILDCSIINHEFLYYLLSFRGLVEFADTSSVPQINNKHIEPIKLAVPPLEEQLKIADIISTVDEQIENTEQLTRKIKELKKGLVQRLLTKGIDHIDFKQTKFGQIPIDWDVTTIGSIADVKSGLTPLRAKQELYYDNGTIPWVKTMDLNNKEVTVTTECVTKLALEETSLTLLPENIVLVAMYGGFNQIGRTGLLKVPGATNQAISALLPKREYLAEYLQIWLNANVKEWKKYAASSRKDPNITKSDVLNFNVLLPPLKEQQKIVEILSSVEKQIENYEQEKQKYIELKKGLMQQLLTGKLRVTV